MQPVKTQAQQLLARGNVNEALRLLLDAEQEYTEDAEFNYLLGQAHAMSRHTGQAIDAFRRCIELRPDLPWTYVALGGVYQSAGRLDEAVDSFSRARQAPNFRIEADIAIAAIEITQGKLAQAGKRLKQLKAETPDNYKLWFEFSRLAKEDNDLDRAVSCLEKALLHNVEYVPALCSLASIRTVQGKIDEAEELYLRARNIMPENPEIRIGLAKLNSYRGDHEKAISIIAPLTGSELISSDLARVYLETAKKSGDSAEAIRYARHVVDQGSLSTREKAGILFALGKEYDRTGRYDEAFDAYRQANDLSRRFYDENANNRHVQKIIDTFSVTSSEQMPSSGNDSSRPVFIIGMPRSGTSLTEQILAAHPEVAAGGELQAIGRMVHGLQARTRSSRSYPENLPDIEQHILSELADDYLEQLLAISSSARCVTNKMPRDFYDLGFITMLFPRAKIIHCRRNAIDNCLSIYFQNFGERGNEYSNNLKMIAGYYQQYRRLMAHWKSMLDINLFELDYEQLVRDQESVSRELVSFCGLQWHQDCLEFHQLDRTIATASYDQVRQPIYDQSVDRWKNYRTHISELLHKLES